MSGRRIVLSAVVGALTLTALLAITILLFGRFGDTEGRILGTTMFLAGFGLLALPAGILFDQHRLQGLAVALLALAAFGFGLATTGVWSGDAPEALGKLTVTVVALGVSAAQTAALAARRRKSDPRVVRALFAASTALAAVLASAAAVAVWAEVDSQLFFRLLGAAAVLDVLLVVLQPVLALMRRAERSYVLHLRFDPPAELDVTVEAPRLSRAVARAIERAEAAGRRVVAVELVEPRAQP